MAVASVPVSVIVPAVVIGEPVTVMPVVPPDRATLVTVPVPVTVVQDGLAPVPPVESTCPLVPGARTVQADPERYSTLPWVLPRALSKIVVADWNDGGAAVLPAKNCADVPAVVTCTADVLLP